MARCLQLMTGFFAMAGLLSIDWGARVNRHRDLLWGGMTGIVLAASLTSILSLVVVAGTVRRLASAGVTSPESAIDALPLSFRWAMVVGIGGVPGGAILILFGLAALAPACYSVSVFGQKLSTHWPRLGQSGWTWLGGAIAFVLGATSCLRRLDLIYCAMGDIFAPIVGVLVASWLRRQGELTGYAPRVNSHAVIAWGLGTLFAIGLDFFRMFNHEYGDWCQPTSVFGFIAAFGAFSLMTSLNSPQPRTLSTAVGPVHSDE